MELKFLVAAGLFAVGTLLSLHLSYSESATASAKFSSFKRQYGKSYASPQEEEYRRSIFEAKLKAIEEHNAKNLSWRKGVNKFSDMTFAEFRKFYLSSVVLDNTDPTGTTFEAPKKGKKDWRDAKAVTPVKDQGQCGSCWAFSATGALESIYAIKKKDKQLKQFSEQELVDCSGDEGNEGCNGGLMTYAYEYIKKSKINLEDDYPYTAQDGDCSPQTDKSRFGLSSYKLLESFDVNALIKNIDNQPVAVAIEVQDDFMDYTEGVYTAGDDCGDGLNHGVLAVGYDTTAKTPFFIVKNSWSEGWGDKGYILMAVGKGRGTCGIANKWDAIPSI